MNGLYLNSVFASDLKKNQLLPGCKGRKYPIICVQCNLNYLDIWYTLKGTNEN